MKLLLLLSSPITVDVVPPRRLLVRLLLLLFVLGSWIEEAYAADGHGNDSMSIRRRHSTQAHQERGEQGRGHQSNNGRRSILCFGGNGMIGSEVLTRLLSASGSNNDDDEEYDIVMVSRGSWPFDTKDTIRPYVTFISCDRDHEEEEEDDDDDDVKSNPEEDDDLVVSTVDGVDEDGRQLLLMKNKKHQTNHLVRTCPELVERIQSTPSFYAVLDFSGFDPEWVQDALELLDKQMSIKAKKTSTSVRVYIYVSTDSVYEVCEPRPKDREKSMEIDAIRPQSPKDRDELNENDSYGDAKLQCEELLEQHQALDDHGIPYVILRFADVMGPRDGGSRFTSYLQWIQYHHHHEIRDRVPPLHVPDGILETSSITYVGDAADSILRAMHVPPHQQATVWNQAYNIACSEVFNTTMAMEMIAHHVLGESITSSGLHIERWPEGAISFYPSITRGPIDITKAQQLLGFRPTPLQDVIQNTCDWYLHQFANNPDLREEMVRDFANDILWGDSSSDSDEDDDDEEEMDDEEREQRLQEREALRARREDLVDTILAEFTRDEL